MSSDEIAIRVRDASKNYLLFDRPEDRLKQMLVPRLERLVGRAPRQYYRDFSALSGVSFEVKRGETIGIIGRNGSGKSTLLQIICGTLSPTGGTVEVNGRIAALLELGAGFNPEFTGRENVYLNAAILGLSQAEVDGRFDSIARFADIGAFIDQPVKTYSSGMYVRLAFATAINVDPDILVVDEALAVGDEAFQRKCFARIEEIKQRGGTVLFVSHGAQTIVQLCDRALLMDGGELILEGRPKAVVGHYQRLINASAERAPIIREEIRQGKTTPESTTTGLPLEQSREQRATDSYDPSLVSQSRIIYDQDGGVIEDLRITRLDGTKVNVLVGNTVYLLRFRVRFSEQFERVGFASLLKTVAGLELGGQTSHAAGEGHAVNAGDVFEVSFPYRISVTTGTYFFNAGVYASSAGEFRQIHRIVDGVAFRVMPDTPERLRIGLVDLVAESTDQPVAQRIEA